MSHSALSRRKCFWVIFVALVVGIIGYKTQKKFHMSVSNTLKVSLVVFLVTFGANSILRIPYCSSWTEFWWKDEGYKLLYIAIVATCFFATTAIITGRLMRKRGEVL